MAHSLHLYQIKDTYYFRCRIPADLKLWFAGRDDIKRTLKTKSLTQAKKLLKVWSYKAERLFTLIRSGALTPVQAHRLVQEFKCNDLKLTDNMEHLSLPEAGGTVICLGGESNPVRAVQVDLLSDVVEKYIAEYKATQKAGAPSIYELETKCRQFVRLVGDMDIKRITRDTVLGYLDVLRKLPKNMAKTKKYAGKSIEDVVRMKPKDIMSDTTLNNYMVRINSFFTWAVRVGYVDRNPADGVKHGKTKLVRPDELRKAYAKSDLAQLATAYIGMKPGEKAKLADSPDRFWLPMIALYSGMRLNEICQLNTHDIKQDTESGVWYFDIDISEGDEKMIKSAAARRKVPVHKALVSLGLLEYRSRMVDRQAPRMWMNLKLTGRGYHKSFANWFLGNGTGKGFLRKYVTTDEKLNFHSFRHTFIDTLKQKRADELIVAEIVGHSNKSMTTGRYGKPFGLVDKLAIMHMVEYGLELETLQELAGVTIG
ncbi:hypothetical protein GMST_42620 [Geomonas silvestris]|uniref:Integrase n=1 Tax=Geomonas silvestris TaxID=2740184 RepID=A0A6V8MPY7_9BACT|nr:site-specific integrase [Geomonas silvestris]GFO61937.1 hypothetical protein GMST_42620 [Geomonas silvestris]